MKRIVLNICFVLFCFVLQAQVNLVPNSSFEDTVSLQSCQSFMIINKAKNWYKPCNCSPDYISICANTYTANYPAGSTIPQTCYGHQFPRTGNAMVGLGTYIVWTVNDSINYYSEYVAVKLTDTLKAGVCYYGEFYAVLGDICEYNTNRLGMYLSQNTFTTSVGSFTNSIECQVQFDTTQYFTDTLNWVKISGTFTAQGGEKYLNLGSFKDGSHVKKISSTSGFNTLCNITGDTHHLTYFYIDDVSLYECDPIGIIERQEYYNIKVYPTPTDEELMIELNLNSSKQNLTLTIYNIIGELVKKQNLQNGISKIDVSDLKSGTYLYHISIDDNEVKKDKLIIIK